MEDLKPIAKEVDQMIEEIRADQMMEADMSADPMREGVTEIDPTTEADSLGAIRADPTTETKEEETPHLSHVREDPEEDPLNAETEAQTDSNAETEALTTQTPDNPERVGRGNSADHPLTEVLIDAQSIAQTSENLTPIQTAITFLFRINFQTEAITIVLGQLRTIDPTVVRTELTGAPNGTATP